MKRINIYIDESIETSIKNLGKLQDRNFSELIREAIIPIPINKISFSKCRCLINQASTIIL